MGSHRFGLQIGLQKAEIVMLIMSDRALRGIQHDNFKIGAGAGITAVTLSSGAEGATSGRGGDIVVWTSGTGAYGGLTFNGSVIKPLRDWNTDFITASPPFAGFGNPFQQRTQSGCTPPAGGARLGSLKRLTKYGSGSHACESGRFRSRCARMRGGDRLCAVRRHKVGRIAMPFSRKLYIVAAAVLLFPAAAFADAHSEIVNATEHAGYAAAAADIAGVHAHLHHALNCLVGPGGNGFDAKELNPCAPYRKLNHSRHDRRREEGVVRSCCRESTRGHRRWQSCQCESDRSRSGHDAEEGRIAARNLNRDKGRAPYSGSGKNLECQIGHEVGAPGLDRLEASFPLHRAHRERLCAGKHEVFTPVIGIWAPM